MTARPHLLRTILAPAIFAIVMIVLWQAVVVIFDLKPFFLPSPIAIGEWFTANFGLVWEAMLKTGLNAVVGLVFGLVIAVVLAVIASRVVWFDRLSDPLVAALSVIPIVALAPVLYTMYGSSSETVRQIIVTISAFIPIFTNALRGLRQAQPILVDLMRAYAASPAKVARYVTIPTALPFVFTGLRIASSWSVIAALVTEYFGGAVGGLGARITSAAAVSSYVSVWGLVLGSVLLGLTIFLVASAIERIVLTRLRAR